MSSIDPNNTFVTTENDLEPAIGGTIYRAATDAELLVAPTVSRYPLDCTNANAIDIILRPATGVGASRRLTAGFVSKGQGTWRRALVSGDTATVFNGTWKGRLEISWPAGTRPQSVPSELIDSFTFVQQPNDG